MNLRSFNIDKSTIVDRMSHFIFIIACHVSVGYLIYLGLYFELFIAYLVSLPLTHIGVSFTYHRVLTHNAVMVPEWILKVLTLYAGLSGQGSGLSWVAVHNAHHKYTSGIKDPHSSLHSHWTWIQLVGYTFREVSGKHAGRILRDPFQVFMHKNYKRIYGTFFLLMLILLPLDLSIMLFFAPIAITWQLQSLANTWGHSWGSDGDSAKDSILMFPFILGDAYHASHHEFPSKVRFHKNDPVGFLAEKIFNRM
jgi:fatty-acid desaturase